MLAGRAALALDNAGLFSELETIEAQLTAALSTLAEAVTVQHTGGALINANEAAARMLGFGSVQELLATPIGRLVRSFDTTTQDDSPRSSRSACSPAPASCCHRRWTTSARCSRSPSWRCRSSPTGAS